MSDPWKLEEILSCFSPGTASLVPNSPRLMDLKATVLRTVAKVSVEFLLTNGIKPHVVFNLAIHPQEHSRTLELYGQSDHEAVRVSMEWHGDDVENTGSFEIEPLSYMDSSHSAYGAFDFPLLKKNLTLWDWCKIFMGMYPDLPERHRHKNLLNFRFVVTSGGSTELMDGCRDFICQCFVRLYDFRVVQCHGSGIGVQGYENFNELIHRRPELVQDPAHRDDFWFFDVIDKNFFIKDDRIKIISTPMHRGIFLDPNVRRIEWFTVDAQNGHPLNYVNEGAGGSPGGPGNGGNGGGRTHGGPPGDSGTGGGRGNSGPPGSGGDGGGRGNGGLGGQPPQGGRGQSGQSSTGGPSTARGQGGPSRSMGSIAGGNQLGNGPVATPAPVKTESKRAPVTTETRQGGQELAHRSKPTPAASTVAHGQQSACAPANARAAPTGTGVKHQVPATATKTAASATTVAHGQQSARANARAAPTGTGEKHQVSATATKTAASATTATHGQATVSTTAQTVQNSKGTNCQDSPIVVKKPPPGTAVKAHPETVVKKPPPGPTVKASTSKPATKKRGT